MRTCIYWIIAATFLGPLLALADAPATSPVPDNSAQLQTPYRTEQEWIISTICRNAFELLAYAKDKKGEAITPAQVTLTNIPGDPLSYDVTVKAPASPPRPSCNSPARSGRPPPTCPFARPPPKR